MCEQSPLALVEDEDELEDQADDMFQTEKKGRYSCLHMLLAAFTLRPAD